MINGINIQITSAFAQQNLVAVGMNDNVIDV